MSITDTESIQYLFVSKVDTSGIIDMKLNVNKLITLILQYLIDNVPRRLTYRIKTAQTSTIKKIDKLIHIPKANYIDIELPERTKIKLSLFTKSSNQYFFPESSKNKYKHLIDGDALLKWWIKVVDGVKEFETKNLLIPGSLDGRQYLLPGWDMGSVFGKDEMAIYNIPNFPDDPKTRFLEFLIIENRWKVNLNNFYQELGFRQEFRLGNVVGIIGCESNWINLTQAKFDTDSIRPIQLTNRQYKKLFKLIKSEDFTILEDIQSLVELKIPRFLSLYNKIWKKIDISGEFVYKPKEMVQATTTVNNLTGLIKKKKKKI